MRCYAYMPCDHVCWLCCMMWTRDIICMAAVSRMDAWTICMMGWAGPANMQRSRSVVCSRNDVIGAAAACWTRSSLQ